MRRGIWGRCDKDRELAAPVARGRKLAIWRVSEILLHAQGRLWGTGVNPLIAIKPR
jgi:hypothetical protein